MIRFIWIMFFPTLCFMQDTVLVWDENMNFSWSYYPDKCPEDKKHSFSVASTCYDLSLEFIGEHTAVVEAHFHSDCSWAHPEFRTTDIFFHEKLHFDIVELFARKFRKKISEQRFSSFNEAKTKITRWHKLFEKEMDKFQDLYDHQTDNSMNTTAQKIWEAKISDEIKQLNMYKSKHIKIKISA
ncbi:MAG: hypothetical protein N3F09_09695 [Bacteroidia bacterium]|nr:hypothetical protein [Bacteroidia bacterium]